MDFHDRTVQGDSLDLDPHDLRLLQALEHPIQDAVLRPTVHPSVDRVPPAESLWQPSPLAAMLRHVEDRIQDLQIRQADVATLHRETVRDLLILSFGDLHAESLYEMHRLV